MTDNKKMDSNREINSKITVLPQDGARETYVGSSEKEVIWYSLRKNSILEYHINIIKKGHV